MSSFVFAWWKPITNTYPHLLDKVHVPRCHNYPSTIWQISCVEFICRRKHCQIMFSTLEIANICPPSPNDIREKHPWLLNSMVKSPSDWKKNLILHVYAKYEWALAVLFLQEKIALSHLSKASKWKELFTLHESVPKTMSAMTQNKRLDLWMLWTALWGSRAPWV